MLGLEFYKLSSTLQLHHTMNVEKSTFNYYIYPKKACLDDMICHADFAMYNFVMHDFSVYTGITNHV